MEPNHGDRKEMLFFGLLVCILVPLEIACAYLAYETIGEVTNTLYFFAVGLNLLFVIVAFRYRTIATLGVVLLALAIIPYQMVLGNRLMRIQSEASRIVTYAYEHRLDSGHYPRSLVNYEFNDADMAQFIQRYDVDPDGSEFSLFYRVGTETTSHSYSSELGWGYYPD
jgi:hypothetical protein